MDVCQLKKDVDFIFVMNQSMSNGGCDIAIFGRINNFLDEHKLSHVLVPEGRYEESSGKTISASIVTALHPPGFNSKKPSRVQRSRVGP